MLYPPTQRRALKPCLLFALLTSTLVVSAQTSTPTSEPAMPMRDEAHHHLVFSNSYVNVFFVEIGPHQSTLFHHHDLPYISVPPAGADAMPHPAGGSPAPFVPHVGYSPGNFSHAVTNSGDTTLRNIAIELVRPQGAVRNRCAAIVRDQPHDTCPNTDPSATNPLKRTPLLESDEVLVESWELAPGATSPPMDDRLDMLVGEITNVTITGESGLSSANALRGGLLWVPAGSKPVFRCASDSAGHLIAITFKDSASPAH